jgi:thiosulfate reductase cytochrome b subunit
MKTIQEKFPLAIRSVHWVNAAVLAMMLWSGLLIYWANPVYRLGWGSSTLIALFPEPFFAALGVSYRLAEGMSLHFFFMWLFAINGLVYVSYMVLSGEWRSIVPGRRSFSEAVQVVLRDLHLSDLALPPRKFNGAQQIAYTAVILMGVGSILTGVAIYKPVQFAWLTRLAGGYECARWAHFWLAAGYVFFFVIHVAQVARAGWNNFRGMVTGYELVSGRPAVTPLEPGPSVERTVS